MRQLRFLLMILPLVLFAGIAFAQKKEITGTVTDLGTGKPLGGVSIVAGKDKGGATTKEDGSFTISVGQNIKVLTFSSVSYTPQTITLAGKTKVDVFMVSETVTQNEVVVIGYGTQKRSNVSGAVSKYKNDRIDETPVSRLDQALQGKIAGVNVQNVSAEAGADPKINIRGISSINYHQCSTIGGN